MTLSTAETLPEIVRIQRVLLEQPVKLGPMSAKGSGNLSQVASVLRKEVS